MHEFHHFLHDFLLHFVACDEGCPGELMGILDDLVEQMDDLQNFSAAALPWHYLINKETRMQDLKVSFWDFVKKRKICISSSNQFFLQIIDHFLTFFRI